MTAHSTTRYEKAIKRNLNELHHAILERKALIGLRDVKSFHAWDYFRITGYALFNDMVSHTIKVFEDNSNSTSFWYLEKSDKAAMDRAARATGVQIKDIKDLCAGLEHIRNKTHFHIDKDAVLNSQKVWKDADVQDDDLGTLLESAASILIRLYKEKTGIEYDVPEYDGTDVREIIKSYVKNNPDVGILI